MSGWADCPRCQARGEVLDYINEWGKAEPVAEQGVPTGLVNAETLRAARGLAGGVGSSTVIDERARKSGKSVPGWRRRAAATSLDGWLYQFVGAVRALPVGTEFTTADLHGQIPDPIHPNHWGVGTTKAAALGLISKVTTQESTLATTNRSLVHRWLRVAEAAVA